MRYFMTFGFFALFANGIIFMPAKAARSMDAGLLAVVTPSQNNLPENRNSKRSEPFFHNNKGQIIVPGPFADGPIFLQNTHKPNLHNPAIDGPEFTPATGMFMIPNPPIDGPVFNLAQDPWLDPWINAAPTPWMNAIPDPWIDETMTTAQGWTNQTPNLALMPNAAPEPKGMVLLLFALTCIIVYWRKKTSAGFVSVTLLAPEKYLPDAPLQ